MFKSVGRHEELQFLPQEEGVLRTDSLCLGDVWQVYLLRVFGVLLEKAVAVQQCVCRGAAAMCSFRVDGWTQWEQHNGGVVPALRCLAFLWMTSCQMHFPGVATGYMVYSHLGSSLGPYSGVIGRAPLWGAWQERGSVSGSSGQHLVKWWHDERPFVMCLFFFSNLVALKDNTVWELWSLYKNI